MLSPEVISNIRGFLERVTLTGKEVPAFTQIQMALSMEEHLNKLPSAPQGPTVAAPPEALPG